MIRKGDTIACPEPDCGLDAEVADNYCERSDPGPFTNVYATFCPAGHHFRNIAEL